MRRARIAGLSIALALLCAPPAQGAEKGIHWEPFEAGIFARARAEGRLVLLELEARWCHWCHVMEQTTFQDARVVKLIGARYLAVRVDEDARPDLAVRYQKWGWPGTIVLSADGDEIVKRRGYLEPARMARLLQATIDDPSPESDDEAGEPVVAAGPLGAARREALLRGYSELFDPQHAGWGRVHKLVYAEPLEYALDAPGGEAGRTMLAMAKRTLDASLALFDPVWGGVYQYSDRLDWSSPHFEKIASVQADALRVYSLAALRFGEPRYLDAARSIDRYIEGFLETPEGGLHGTQDADLDAKTDGHRYYALDDRGRRALGIPRVDPHLYARENGWLIQGLVALAAASGDPAPLARARRAAEWILAHRGLPVEKTTGGEALGFRHDERDPQGGDGPYLGDTLAMGQALLDLHGATGERAFLARAEAAQHFIEARFRVADGGYRTAAIPLGATGALARSVRDPDENVACARFAIRLHHATGRADYRAAAEHALRYLVAVSPERPFFPGLLLVDREVSTAPAHFAVVGRKDDPKAAALFAAALRAPRGYKRVEWWDRREGKLPNADVDYPDLPGAAAFACSGSACSFPVKDPEKLPATIARVLE